MTEAQAYKDGWKACMAGLDGRFVNPHSAKKNFVYAWNHGFLDAMEAKEGEEPEPTTAGYTE